MTRHYSTKDFFRQMPMELLARYFKRKGREEMAALATSEGATPEALFLAWLELSEDLRHGMDAEFSEIFDLSCDKGWVAIRDEAQVQMHRDPAGLDAFVTSHAERPNHFHRAMVTFLDHPECWKGATRFYHADNLSYWRKRKHMGHRPAATDEGSLRELADRLRDYFRHTEGRGDHCLVEYYRRGSRDYFFAYPEDYSQQSVEWVDGSFGRRAHNPAFEVVYIYSQTEGSLDVNAPGARKALEALQGIFATTVLKHEELPPEPKDERVYELEPLLDRTFTFTHAPGSGIESVAVKKLRLSSRVNPGNKVTLEADPKRDPLAVYTLLDRVKEALPAHLYDVTQVELAAAVVKDPNRPAKSVTIRITHPRSCSLKYDEVDLRLRGMLEASGIEPRGPEPEDPEASSGISA